MWGRRVRGRGDRKQEQGMGGKRWERKTRQHKVRVDERSLEVPLAHCQADLEEC